MTKLFVFIVALLLLRCGAEKPAYFNGDGGGNGEQENLDGTSETTNDIPQESEGDILPEPSLPEGGDTAGDGASLPDETQEDGEEEPSPYCVPIQETGCGAEEERERACDGLDNDCDGRVDEGCHCNPGEVRSCFRGMPARRGIGGCTDGFQVCPSIGEFPTWNECEGGIIESPEVCDGKDNDCNGCVDDIPECHPSVFCPTDMTASPLRWFQLSGDAIYAGQASSWRWTVTPPSGSATTNAECPTCKNTRVWLDLSGNWLVRVEFVDALGVEWSCEFVIRVLGGGLRIEMWWNEGVVGDLTDVDLHLHRNPPRNGWFNADDCYFANCDRYPWDYSINWGYPITPPSLCPSPPPQGSNYATGCPNPRLDLDDVRGNGPENINIDIPNDGDQFRVMVHYWDDYGREGLPAPTYVRIYCGGVVKSLFGPAEIYNQGPGMGDIWRVADITWSGSDCTVTPLGSGGSFDIRPDASRDTF